MALFVTFSSKDTNYCFYLQYILLGHCEKVEKLLQFDMKEEFSTIYSGVLVGFVRFYLSNFIFRPKFDYLF